MTISSGFIVGLGIERTFAISRSCGVGKDRVPHIVGSRPPLSRPGVATHCVRIAHEDPEREKFTSELVLSQGLKTPIRITQVTW